eukprot:107527-Rhodomonas_salina.1
MPYYHTRFTTAMPYCRTNPGTEIGYDATPGVGGAQSAVASFGTVPAPIYGCGAPIYGCGTPVHRCGAAVYGC